MINATRLTILSFYDIPPLCVNSHILIYSSTFSTAVREYNLVIFSFLNLNLSATFIFPNSFQILSRIFLLLNLTFSQREVAGYNPAIHLTISIF